MMWFFAILLVLVMGGVAVVAAGRGRRCPRRTTTGPTPVLPADGPLGADDLRRVRFSLAFRGYRMSEVDALLDRLARQLERPQPGPETACTTRARIQRVRGEDGHAGVGHTSARVDGRDRLRADRPGGWSSWCSRACGWGAARAPAGSTSAPGCSTCTPVAGRAGARLVGAVPGRLRGQRARRPRLVGHHRASAFWWIVTIAGLLILVRWLPSRGTARLRGLPGQLVGGAGSLGPRARRHAGRRVRLHLRLPDQRGLTRGALRVGLADGRAGRRSSRCRSAYATSPRPRHGRRAARPGDVLEVEVHRQVRRRAPDQGLAPGQPARRSSARTSRRWC